MLSPNTSLPPPLTDTALIATRRWWGGELLPARYMDGREPHCRKHTFLPFDSVPFTFSVVLCFLCAWAPAIKPFLCWRATSVLKGRLPMRLPATGGVPQLKRKPKLYLFANAPATLLSKFRSCPWSVGPFCSYHLALTLSYKLCRKTLGRKRTTSFPSLGYLCDCIYIATTLTLDIYMTASI